MKILFDLCVLLCMVVPQMSGFIKYFENNAKNMLFMTEDKDVYLNYSEIWDKIKKVLKLKFTTNPICDKKYILTKLRVFNDVNRTTFTDDQVPKERNHFICIAAIDIDSVLKIDKKSIAASLFRAV